MNLIIFDIDGTIVDSVRADDQCFIQSFEDLYNIDLSQANWNDFEHVTDSGLTNEIFESYFNRTPTENETLELKNHFYLLLKQRVNEITEIKGAKNTLLSLINHPDFLIVFATGGWKETATLKLSAIGFELGKTTLISSNDHFDRSEITRLAIKHSLSKTGLIEFETITYVGDGLWDLNTTKKLGINFIGVDKQCNNKLLNAGATQVTNDLEDVQQIISWTKRATGNRR